MSQRKYKRYSNRKLQIQNDLWKQEQDNFDFITPSVNNESITKNQNKIYKQNTSFHTESHDLNMDGYHFHSHNDITVLLAPGYIAAHSDDFYEKDGRIIAQNPLTINLLQFERVINHKQSPIINYLWQVESKVKSILQSIKNSLIQNNQDNQKKDNVKQFQRVNIQQQFKFTLKQEVQQQLKNKQKRRLRRGSMRLQIYNNQFDHFNENKEVKDGLEQFRILSTPVKSSNERTKIMRDLNMSIWHTQGLKIGSDVTKFAIKKKDVVIIAHSNLTNLVQLTEVDQKIKELLIKNGITSKQDIDRQTYKYKSSQIVRLKSLKSKNRLEYWSKHIRKHNPKCIVGHLYILQSQKSKQNQEKVANQSKMSKLAKKGTKNLCFPGSQQSDEQFEKPKQILKQEQQKISIFPISQFENEYIIMLQMTKKKKSSFLQIDEVIEDNKTRNDNRQRLQRIVDDLLSQYFKINSNISSTNTVKKKLDFTQNNDTFNHDSDYPSYSKYKIHKSINLRNVPQFTHQRKPLRRGQSLNMHMKFDDDELNYEQIHQNISKQHINISLQNCEDIIQIRQKEKNGKKAAPKSLSYQIDLKLSQSTNRQRPKQPLRVQEQPKTPPKISIRSANKQKRSSSIVDFLQIFCCTSKKKPQSNKNSLKIIDDNPRIQK